MFTSDHIDQLLDAARKDGEHTAMLIAINVVDAFIERSDTLREFAGKWDTAKGVWQDAVGDQVSDMARLIAADSAADLRNALAVFQEHRETT